MPGEMASAKAKLRAAALARRDGLTPQQRAAAAAALARHRFPVSTAGRVLAAYWPIRSEIDPRPLLKAIGRSAAGWALPAVGDGRLAFRAFAEGDALVAAPFGLSEPAPTAAPAVPDILLVPLAAFDRSGGRLGYGRGYYDGYLAARRAAGKGALAIGIGFACQEEARLPSEAHDQRLDWVLTEDEIIRCAG